MDEDKYLELLDRAYEELPTVLYKQERFEIPKVTGKLIKTRTVVSNFTDIAKHFARDKDHFFKFFLKEIGVRGEYNPRGELILHSRFQPAMLNKVVVDYFNNYVKCPHCNSPDTIFTPNGDVLRCNACGHQEKIKKL